MLISWDWLKKYVALDMSDDELALRLTMAGLNHEGTKKVGEDLQIDLEVTSNRPDCLGHIGVAREVAVLWDKELSLPAAQPESGPESVDQLTRVALECPDLCYRYTARVIKGIKVGPSPDWLARRLETLGIAVINNVVDITNYVLMESAQPLHAFDLAQLAGAQIVVRESRQGEEFKAIDHRTYTLDAGTCVIADADRPVALGGVMGGADTEVSDGTTDLLIEAAEFDQISIRTTARRLNLHSPSSYRFERGVDPNGVDWASRRCCEMILDLAGGELAAGVVDVGRERSPNAPITLRLSQLSRILGIQVGSEEVRRILRELGTEEVQADADQVCVRAPSWRRDLTREIDLVEEVARIHGYDKIPEDASVPMVPSHRTDDDRILATIRRVLNAAGYDESMTYSVVSEEWSRSFSPWTDAEPLRSSTPMLRGADHVRRSLIPSLLGARKVNESLANPTVELFETARAYLPQDDQLPRELLLVGITTGQGFFELKGVIERLVTALNSKVRLAVEQVDLPLLDRSHSCRLLLDGEMLGYLGIVNEAAVKLFGLKSPAAVAELSVEVLASQATLIPQHAVQSPYPSITRDLNLVVDESIQWRDIDAVTRDAAGDVLELVQFLETYRDPGKDGKGKKRLLFSVTLRSDKRTLTGDEADGVRQAIEHACQQQHGAVLLG